MKIGIIDADLIGRKNHRFPNLACMKLSGYWKDHGAQVDLLLTYEGLAQYDKVFVSKVFITSAGKDRKAKGGGRNWKRQRDDAVICA